MKFKVGNKVKIVSSENGSINKVDDTGIITEYELDEHDGLDYRVFVEGRTGELRIENIANWHTEGELEIVNED
jgi:hypothetical protein